MHSALTADLQKDNENRMVTLLNRNKRSSSHISQVVESQFTYFERLLLVGSNKKEGSVCLVKPHRRRSKEVELNIIS